MEIKQLLQKGINTVVNAVAGAFPALGGVTTYLIGSSFTWNLSGSQAYRNKMFYSAVNILVLKLNETPILFNKVKVKNPKLSKYYAKNLSNVERKRFKEMTLEEQEDHPLNVLFDDPNTYQSGIELMEDFWYNYSFGDGYLFFEAPDSGRNKGIPKRVHSISRGRVREIKSNDAWDGISHYEVTTLTGNIIKVDKEYMLHLPKWNPNSEDLRGLSPADIAAPTISLDNENTRAQGAAFVNGGRGTLFSSDVGINKDGNRVAMMKKEEREELADTMQKDFAGAGNNRKMHFTNNKVVVQQYGDTLAEMDLVNSGEKGWKYVFAIMGIPPVLGPVSDGNTESNVKAGYKSLVTNKIVPELRKFDHKLNKKIKTWWPDIIACHDLTEFSELAPDLEITQKVFGAPFLTVNQTNALYNYPEVEDKAIGNMILIPNNRVPIQDAGLSNAFNEMDRQGPNEKDRL